MVHKPLLEMILSWLLVLVVTMANVASASSGVCDRTKGVIDAIVSASGNSDCADVTDTDLESITFLDLGVSIITPDTLKTLKTGDFAGLTKMTQLWMDGNSLTSLPEDVFDPLTKLTELRLDRNKLTSLPAKVFDKTTELTELRLDRNKLTSLPAKVFDPLTKLTELWLSYNKLTSLPEDVFDKPTNLEELYLGANGLTSLRADAFDKLTKLTFLNLDNNNLTTLPAGVFDKLTSLEQLPLTGNGLTSLPAGVFDKLTSLKKLWLKSNKLTSLPTGVFDKTTSLTHLFLHSNKLTSLRADVFDKLTSLEQLWLMSNNLTSLPAGVFDKLTSLTYLPLSFNFNLRSLPAGVFDKLTSLTHLFLQGTSLTSLPTGLFDKLTSLEKLFLGRSRLTNLSPSTFDKLAALNELGLDAIGLTSLPVGIFDQLTSLKKLWLTQNPNLTCLPSIPSSVTTLRLDKDKDTYAICGTRVRASVTTLHITPGETATYNVVLDLEPTGDVTVTPTSSATDKVTVSEALTFTQSNWSTSQTVTVTAVTAGTATISHPATGGDYENAPTDEVDVNPPPTAAVSGPTEGSEPTESPEPVPIPPLRAIAGRDITVAEGALVRLKGRVNRDSTRVQYAWTQRSGQSVSLDSAKTATPTFTAPSQLIDDIQLTFRLTVTKGHVNRTDDMQVTVKAGPNDAPVITVSPDQQVPEGVTVRLSGSATDPEGEAITYAWTQTGGPEVRLSRADTVHSTFKAPRRLTEDAVLTLALTATDARGAAATVAVTVTTLAGVTVHLIDAAQTVPGGTLVQLAGTTAIDEATYVWVQIGGPTVVLSSSDIARPTFTAPTGLAEDTMLTFMLVAIDACSAPPVIHPVDIPVEEGTVDFTALFDVFTGAESLSGAGWLSGGSGVWPDTKVWLSGGSEVVPDGAYAWTQTSGPFVVLSDSYTAQATFTAPRLLEETVLPFALVTADACAAIPVIHKEVVTVEASEAPALTFPAAPVADQAYTAGTAIRSLPLPVAVGGAGQRTYSVSGLPTGLSFAPATRTITGTPEAATNGAVAVTYTATDGVGTVASLTFNITVNPPLSFATFHEQLEQGEGKVVPTASADEAE